MRWRDRVRKDLKSFWNEESSWYRVAQERGSWRGKCRTGLEDERRLEEDQVRKKRKAVVLRNEVLPGGAAALPFICDTCQRAFRRSQDIARHNCVTTRPKGQVMSRPPS